MIVDLGTLGRFPILNGYLMISEGTGALVETGPSNIVDDYLDRASKHIGISKISIALVSHVHVDHSGGAWKIVEKLPNMKIAVYNRGAKHLIDPSKLLDASAKTLGDILNVWGEVKPVSGNKLLALNDGDTVKVGNYELELIATPGHASHSSAWYLREEKTIFPGDSMGMLFNGNQIWPAAPPPFNFEMFMQSIERLRSLNAERVCFPHFGCSDASIFNKVVDAYIKVNEAVRANCGSNDATILNAVLSMDNYAGMPRDGYFTSFLMMNLRGLPGYACQS